VAAIFAALDMPAERGRAALLDRRHDLELTQAQISGIGPAPVGLIAMKDVCDLQLRAAHGGPARPRVAASRRSVVQAGRVAGYGPDRGIGDAGVSAVVSRLAWPSSHAP